VQTKILILAVVLSSAALVSFAHLQYHARSQGVSNYDQAQLTSLIKDLVTRP